MAAPVALSALVTLAREWANQETLDPTQALADDEELGRIGNSALAHIWRRLVTVRGANYYRKTPPASFVTANGVDTYPLPTDMFELVGLDWVRAANDYVTLVPFQDDERNQYRNRIGWVRNVRNARIMFQLQATNLVLIPTPTTVETIRVHYVPAYVPASFAAGSGATFDGVAGFTDYAAWKMAAHLARKDENFQLEASCNAEASAIEAEIRRVANRRDLSGPPRIVRTRRRRQLGSGLDDL